MYERKILPFYMTYPLPMYYQEEDSIIRDLEYLQQMYPTEAKKYQKIIASILDKLDYEGSMIYDEYPDRFSMERQSRMICDRLKSKYRDDDKCKFRDMLSWEGFQDIVRLLMYDEILKRRHRKNRGYLRF